MRFNIKFLYLVLFFYVTLLFPIKNIKAQFQGTDTRIENEFNRRGSSSGPSWRSSGQTNSGNIKTVDQIVDEEVNRGSQRTNSGNIQSVDQIVDEEVKRGPQRTPAEADGIFQPGEVPGDGSAVPADGIFTPDELKARQPPQSGNATTDPSGSPTPRAVPVADHSTTSNATVAEPTITADDVNNKILECNASLATAQAACDAESNKELTKTKNSFANFVLQSGQMTSTAFACTSLANMTSAANAALAGYRVNCEVSQSSCVDACASAETLGSGFSGLNPEIAKAKDNRRKCERMVTNVNQASQALQNTLATTMQKATACKNQFSGNYCAQDPNAPGCEPVDCTGTMADTNPVCICQKDPNNPVCNGVAGGPQVGNGGLSGGAGSGEIAGGNRKTNGLAQEANSIVSGIGDREELMHGIPSKAGHGDDPGGKKGGGANLGSDSAGGGGGKRNNGGYYADSAKGPINGFYGSSGGGGSGGSRSPSSSGGYRNSNRPNQPNLRDFLPGGALASRIKNNYVGSIGKDGVTGPHSSLWTKIKFRYRVNQGTLLPY